MPQDDIVITGYPKFSAFFREEFDRTAWKLRFRLDPGRRTVAYLSTHGRFSSLDGFSRARHSGFYRVGRSQEQGRSALSAVSSGRGDRLEV